MDEKERRERLTSIFNRLDCIVEDFKACRFPHEIDFEDFKAVIHSAQRIVCYSRDWDGRKLVGTKAER